MLKIHAKNSIALGVSAKILGIDEEVLYKIFRENYPAKVLDMNISAAKIGIVFCPDEMKVNIPKSNSSFKDYLLLTGNEAIALDLELLKQELDFIVHIR